MSMPNPYRCVIFDLDGTLVNAFGAVSASVNHALRRMGLPERSHRAIRRSVGWGERALLRTFVGDDRLEEAIHLYDEAHEQALDDDGVRPLAGAKSVLSWLKRQEYVLAVGSNRPYRFTQQILKILNFDSYFDAVLCGDQVKNPKPSADIVRELIKMLGVRSAQTMYVGDMAIDVQTARRARVTSVAVLTGTCTADQLKAQSPHYLIERLTQLKGILDSMKSRTKER